MEITTVGLLLVTIIGWGIWGFVQKVGISKIGVEICLLLNSSTFFLVVLSYLALFQKIHIPRSGSVIYPIVGGVSAAISSIAFFTALEKTPVSIARPLAGLSVLITALLGLLFLGETLTVRQYIGIGVAIAAIILLSG